MKERNRAVITFFWTTQDIVFYEGGIFFSNFHTMRNEEEEVAPPGAKAPPVLDESLLLFGHYGMVRRLMCEFIFSHSAPAVHCPAPQPQWVSFELTRKG